MKNGIPEASDSDILMSIYRKIDVINGTVKEPLTCEEMVMIFALAQYLNRLKES